MSKNEWYVAILIAGVSAIALLIWGILVDWRGSTSLSVGGLYVSVAGFALAIAEIRKTASATRAAETAIANTLRAVTAEGFLVTLTRLRQSAVELDNAIADQHVERARRALNDWGDEASVCIGLVERQFGVDHSVIDSLKTTADTTRETKSGLYTAGQEVWHSTAECLQSMEKATDQVGPLQQDD